MEKICKSFLACDAEIRELVKPLMLGFFNIENKKDKDFDMLTAILNKFNTTVPFENNNEPHLEIDMGLDIQVMEYVKSISYLATMKSEAQARYIKLKSFLEAEEAEIEQVVAIKKNGDLSEEQEISLDYAIKLLSKSKADFYEQYPPNEYMDINETLSHSSNMRHGNCEYEFSSNEDLSDVCFNSNCESPEKAVILAWCDIPDDVITATALPELPLLNVDTDILRKTMSRDDFHSQEVTVGDDITVTSQQISIMSIDMVPTNSIVISDSDTEPEPHDVTPKYVYNETNTTTSVNNNNVPVMIDSCELAPIAAYDSRKEHLKSSVPNNINWENNSYVVTDDMKIDNVSKSIHSKIKHKSSIVMERNNMCFSSDTNVTKSVISDTGQNEILVNKIPDIVNLNNTMFGEDPSSDRFAIKFANMLNVDLSFIESQPIDNSDSPFKETVIDLSVP